MLNQALEPAEDEEDEDMISIYGGDSDAEDFELYTPSPKKKRDARDITEAQIQKALAHYRSGPGKTRTVAAMAHDTWVKSRDDIDNILLRSFSKYNMIHKCFRYERKQQNPTRHMKCKRISEGVLELFIEKTDKKLPIHDIDIRRYHTLYIKLEF